MKKIAFLMIFGAFMFSSCAMTMTPVTGFIFTDAKGPLTATASVKGKRAGTTEATSILGLVGIGDASIETAARNGGITKISHVDYHTFNVLGIYAKVTVTVYGD